MRIKSHGQRATPSPFLTPSLPQTTANPFNQQVLAWVNGTHFFSPIHAPTVRKRRPRTQFIDLSQGW